MVALLRLAASPAYLSKEAFSHSANKTQPYVGYDEDCFHLSPSSAQDSSDPAPYIYTSERLTAAPTKLYHILTVLVT